MKLGARLAERMRHPVLAKVVALVRSAAFDFGGVVVFYVLLWTAGLKPAIAGTILFLAVDFVRRRRRHLGFPRIYVLSSALVIAFGFIDLASSSPFMIKYEAPISSLAVGAMFALGARGKSIVQELVEQQAPDAADDSPEMRRFFQLMTAMWAAYFVIKAGVYLWIGEVMTIERALEVRPIISFVSLGAMMALCTQGQFLFALCERLHLLPRPAEPDSPG